MNIIIDLEEKYMKEISDKILSSEELKDLCIDAGKFIDDNYDKINKDLITENKISHVLERIIFFIATKKFNIKNIYPSPNTSDIALELSDCFLNIDAKTVNIESNTNKVDSFDVSVSPNQCTFKNKRFCADYYVNKFKGYNFIGTQEPEIDDKPNLTFIIKLLYRDDKKKKTFKINKNSLPEIKIGKKKIYYSVCLQCVPNGKLIEQFNYDLVSNAKTYKYIGEKEAIRYGINYKPKIKPDDDWEAIYKKNKNGKETSVKFYIDKKNKNPLYEKDFLTWQKMKKGTKFEARLNIDSARLIEEKIEYRKNSKGKEWKGIIRLSF